MIYLDNAATSFFKPESVIKAVENALRNYSANPGRSGHKLSVGAAEKIYRVREKVADFFGCDTPENVVFTPNCTHSINCVLKGSLDTSDHLIISNLEHNAVARPAYSLNKNNGVDLGIFNAFRYDTKNELKKLINPHTKMIFLTHASNVCGKILPIEEIGEFCKENGILFGVDAAQSGGILPINMEKMGIDFLCVAPHKSLFAPMGTGILIARKKIKKTIIEGGTGTASLSLFQPEDMPERLESGTVNLPGIMGVGAGIDFVKSKGIKRIFMHETNLCKILCEKLKESEKIRAFWREGFAPVVSLTVDKMSSEEIASYLSDNGIAVRGGYHCAPLAHNTLNTVKSGTVRISPCINNTPQHMKTVGNLLLDIAKNR
jgi:cysteine desulfurase family protein